MPRKMWKFRLGIVLISVSILVFLILFVLPFLSFDLKVKITLSTLLLIAGEGLFWLGIVLIGKEVYLKFKARLMSVKTESKKSDILKDPSEK